MSRTRQLPPAFGALDDEDSTPGASFMRRHLVLSVGEIGLLDHVPPEGDRAVERRGDAEMICALDLRPYGVGI